MSCRSSEFLVMDDPTAPPPDHLDLSDLADRARDGDGRCGELLFREARPRLLRIALAAGIDPDGAADLVQDTLLSVHRNLSRFDREKGSFQAWSGLALLRRIRNRRRSAWRMSRLLHAVRLHAPRTSSGAQRRVEARLTIRRLLSELTDRQREVVALYEIGKLSAAEVARCLEITPAGVRSIARDARLRLTAAAARLHGTGEREP